MQLYTLNTPVTLTLIRLIISPLILPVALIYLMPYENSFFNIILAALFLLLALTDFLDGYLARKYNQVTFLGKALDPIADKFLLFSALIALLAIKKIFFLWVILFIAREFFVMGLRILALEQGFDIPVCWLGKAKTVTQILYIACVILNTRTLFPNFYIDIEDLFLYLAIVLSIMSATLYGFEFINKMKSLVHYQDNDI